MWWFLGPWALTFLTTARPALAHLKNTVDPLDKTPAIQPLVSSQSLRPLITLPALKSHLSALQDIAYSNPFRNRALCPTCVGLNNSISYLEKELEPFSSFLAKLEDPWIFWPGTSRHTNISYINPLNGTVVEIPNYWLETASWSRSTAAIQGKLVPVAENGCQDADYIGVDVKGEIAFVKGGGSCSHYTKGAVATKMGAKAMIAWDPENKPYREARYGGKRTPYPGSIPIQTIGIGGNPAATLSKLILSGNHTSPKAVVATLNVYNPGVPADKTYTKNICYETTSGDKNKVIVLGAHIDSVMAGPGINDNGSGVSAILEIAKRLSKFSLVNRFRFCFWSGEEQGLLGSSFYVENLSAAEKGRIIAYLNFDMIGSPHPAYGIMSGNRVSHDGLLPPPGSSGLTDLWTTYFTDEKVPFEMYAFEGHTDHTAFRDAGIPIGAMDTGGMGKKTEADVKKYGGKVGDKMDTFYHTANDTLENVDLEALLIEARAIAHVVGILGVDLSAVEKAKTVQRNGIEIEEKSLKWRTRRTRRRRRSSRRRVVKNEDENENKGEKEDDYKGS